MPELNLLKITGLDSSVLIVLVSFPVVATLAGIARHIIGIKSLSVYSPIILTYAFYALSLSAGSGESHTILGLVYGLLCVSVVVFSALISSQILKYSRMHYFPKISIVLSISAISLLLAIILSRKIITPEVVQTNFLALVLIVLIAEQFTATMFKKQAKIALVLTFETLITAILAYLLISWPTFQTIMLSYPYLVVAVSLTLSFLVGKYRGLRFLEFIRFREVLKIAEPAND